MTRVTKRCEKCGQMSVVSPRMKRCRRQTFGPRSYWCYGQLVVVPKPTRADVDAVPAPVGRGVGWVLSDEAEAARCAAFRARAQAKLDRANAKAEEAHRAIVLGAKRLKAWQAKVRRYQKQAALTDAEIAATRARRLQAKSDRAARKIRRAIQVAR